MKEGKVPITDISAAVTAIGRRMIYDTKKAVEDKGFTVVYGDTDSVMVKMPGKNMAEAWAANRELAHFITNVLFGHIASVSIEAEKIFLVSVFCDKKKRYFGLCNEGEARDKVTGEYFYKMMCKGIELVRRDACPFINDIMKQALDLMMTRTGDNRAEVTGPLIRALLVRELERVVTDQLPMHKYYLNKCARSTYKALPAHIYVFRLHNDRVRSGQMAKIGEHNRALNALDGGKRTVKFEMYHSGTRFDYVVYYMRRAKVQRDHVEDPEWVNYHNSITGNPARRILIDRLHYLQTYVTAVVPVLLHHVPDAAVLFEAAAAQVHGQLARHATGSRAITDFTVSTRVPSAFPSETSAASSSASSSASPSASSFPSETSAASSSASPSASSFPSETSASSSASSFPSETSASSSASSFPSETSASSSASSFPSETSAASSLPSSGSVLPSETSVPLSLSSSSSSSSSSSESFTSSEAMPVWAARALATEESNGASGGVHGPAKRKFKFMHKVTTAQRVKEKTVAATKRARAAASGVASRGSIQHCFEAVRAKQALALDTTSTSASASASASANTSPQARECARARPRLQDAESSPAKRSR